MTSDVMGSIYDFASEYKYISLVAQPKTCNIYSSVKEWVESLVKLEDQNNFYKTFKLNLTYTIYKKIHQIFTQNLVNITRPKRSELRLKYVIRHLKNNFPNIKISKCMLEYRGGVKIKIEGKKIFFMTVSCWSASRYLNDKIIPYKFDSDPEFALLEAIVHIKHAQYEVEIRHYTNIEDFIYAINTYFE
jgi:hypothetical protein